MKEKVIHKTIIKYRVLARKEGVLEKMGRDLWQLCGVTEQAYYFSKKVIEPVLKKLTSHEKYFEDFWEKYPVKKSKKDCENKFALIPESELDNVMAGLQEYLKSWDRKIKLKDLQYIPSPLTWINRQSWNDEVIYDSETLSHIKANELRDKKIKREAEEEHEKIKNMQARKELDDKIKRLGDKERNDILSMLRNKIMKERPKIASNPKMLEYTVDAQFRTYIKNNY